MPKYHFEIIDGYTIKDPVGIDLGNETQAKSLAHDIARQIRIDVGDTSARKVLVLNAEGVEVYETPIRGPK